jgi:hypothetical protein
VGRQILGEAITNQAYSKANLLKVPESDRILVPKLDDEDDSRMHEELNNQCPLVLHKADHGGKIAYLGFVNDADNIPGFVKAICMGVSTSSLS